MRFNIWKDYEYMDLPDILSFIVDNRGKTVPTDVNGNHILIATNCIRNENLYPSYDKVRLIGENTYKNWFRAHPKPGDIIFVNKGTPGRVCMVPDPVDFCIAQDMIALRVKREIIYNKYLLAVLRSKKIQNQIAATTVGDVIPHFKKQQLREIKIPVPSMKIQKIIGDYYFAFCKKELINNKINRNLQEQCDAIYKNMFEINFDDNWRVGYLSELITIKYGKDHKKLGNGNIPCYGSGGVMRYVEKSIYDHESVLIPRKGTLNNVLYVNTPFWSVDTMFYTVMKLANVAKFVYHFVKEKDLDLMNAGSAVPSMTTDILYAMELRIPSDDVLAKFEDFVSPLYKAISDNSVENKKLAEVRDTLLSKLMTGELDVSALEM